MQYLETLETALRNIWWPRCRRRGRYHGMAFQLNWKPEIVGPFLLQLVRSYFWVGLQSMICFHGGSKRHHRLLRLKTEQTSILLIWLTSKRWLFVCQRQRTGRSLELLGQLALLRLGLVDRKLPLARLEKHLFRNNWCCWFKSSYFS